MCRPNCNACVAFDRCVICFVTFIGNECNRCTNNCHTCKNTPDDCVDCRPGFGYTNVTAGPDTCTACLGACTICRTPSDCYICMPGTFRTGTSCVPCSNNCQTCSSPTNCITCVT